MSGGRTRLRQIALVAQDLDPTVALLCEALGAEVVERDDGVASFGLHNALIQIGDTFLEVVSLLLASPCSPSTSLAANPRTQHPPHPLGSVAVARNCAGADCRRQVHPKVRGWRVRRRLRMFRGESPNPQLEHPSRVGGSCGESINADVRVVLADRCIRYMTIIQVPSLEESEAAVSDLKTIYAGGRDRDGHTYRKHKPGTYV